MDQTIRQPQKTKHQDQRVQRNASPYPTNTRTLLPKRFSFQRTRRIRQFGRDPLNLNGLICEKHNYICTYTNIYMYRWFSHQNFRHSEQTHQPPQKLPRGRPDVQLHPAGTCSRCCCCSMRCNCTCLMAVDHWDRNTWKTAWFLGKHIET